VGSGKPVAGGEPSGGGEEERKVPKTQKLFSKPHKRNGGMGPAKQDTGAGESFHSSIGREGNVRGGIRKKRGLGPNLRQKKKKKQWETYNQDQTKHEKTIMEKKERHN